MNWKHGGKVTYAIAVYNIIPSRKRYNAGTCAVKIREDNWLDGNANNTYKISVDHLDGTNTSIGGNTDMVGKAINVLTTAEPYVTDSYYAALTISLDNPDTKNDLSFQIGSQTWTTVPKSTCGYARWGQVGDWDGSWYLSAQVSTHVFLYYQNLLLTSFYLEPSYDMYV